VVDPLMGLGADEDADTLPLTDPRFTALTPREQTVELALRSLACDAVRPFPTDWHQCVHTSEPPDGAWAWAMELSVFESEMLAAAGMRTIKKAALEGETEVFIAAEVLRQKRSAILMKHKMDMDEMTFIGDNALGATGLLNHPGATEFAIGTLSDPKTLFRNLTDGICAAVSSGRGPRDHVPDDEPLPLTIRNLIVLLPISTFGQLATTRSWTMASQMSRLEKAVRDVLPRRASVTFVPSRWMTEDRFPDLMAVVYPNDPAAVSLPLTPLRRTLPRTRETRGDSRIVMTYVSRAAPLTVSYPSLFRHVVVR
jgi:hypothetical protein